MKKDRSQFTLEELISEVEFLEIERAELAERLKTNYDRGYEAGLSKFKSLVYPLYLQCFTEKGWIGYANINTNKVGKPLLELLAAFHGKIK
jgi:hypothetical protein